MYGSHILYKISLPFNDDDEIVNHKAFIVYLQGMINHHEDQQKIKDREWEEQRNNKPAVPSLKKRRKTSGVIITEIKEEPL